MSRPLPWFPVVAAEERELLDELSLAARGADFTLRCASWIRGPLEADKMRTLARATPREWASIWPEIRHRWTESAPGLMTAPRLEALRERQEARSREAAEAAQRRHGKRTEIHETAHADAMPTHSGRTADALPTHCDLRSETEIKRKTDPEIPSQTLPQEGLDPGLAVAPAGGQADLFGQTAAGEVKQAAQVRKTRRPKPQADPAEPPKVKLADFERALEANTERWTILTGPAATSAIGAQIQISACVATLDDAAVVGRHLQATENTARQFTSHDLARRGWLATAIQKARAWEKRGEPEPRYPGQRERAPVAPISTVRETTPERAAEWARFGKMGGGQ